MERILIRCGFLMLLLSGAITFQQNEYKVVFERLEVVNYSTTYVGFAKTHNFKYNRTKAVVNITVEMLHNVEDKLNIEVQAYRFASNEYRLFPIRFSFNFCEYVARNDFGVGELYKCGNLTGCLFKQGVHQMCNWFVNGTKCPPNIPSGSYMLDLKYIYRSVEILFLQIYGIVKYPEIKGFSTV